MQFVYLSVFRSLFMAHNVFVEKQQLQGTPGLALNMASLYLEVVKR
jgi:hypothetical protein